MTIVEIAFATRSRYRIHDACACNRVDESRFGAAGYGKSKSDNLSVLVNRITDKGFGILKGFLGVTTDKHFVALTDKNTVATRNSLLISFSVLCTICY